MAASARVRSHGLDVAIGISASHCSARSARFRRRPWNTAASLISASRAIRQARFEQAAGLIVLVLMKGGRVGQDVRRHSVHRLVTNRDGLGHEVGGHQFGGHAVLELAAEA
jgi:hypothetical protein